MRPDRLLGLLFSLAGAGCGARPGTPAAIETTAARSAAPSPPRDPFVTAALAPTGLPGMGPYRLLVLAGPEVDELEVVGVAYAATVTGWRVTIAGPAGAPLRGGRGVALPLDKTFEAVEAAGAGGYDAIFLPSGAPVEPAAKRLIEAFGAGPSAGRVVAATNDGLARLRDLPLLGTAVPASPDEGVRLDGARLIAARAGDLPALVHAMESYARVHWPRPSTRPPE